MKIALLVAAAAIALVPISVALAPISVADPPPCDPNSSTENMGNLVCFNCVTPAEAAHDNVAYAACFGMTMPQRAGG
jgi:hypothetical protein